MRRMYSQGELEALIKKQIESGEIENAKPILGFSSTIVKLWKLFCNRRNGNEIINNLPYIMHISSISFLAPNRLAICLINIKPITAKTIPIMKAL